MNRIITTLVTLLFVAGSLAVADTPVEVVFNGQHGNALIRHNEDGTYDFDVVLDNGQRLAWHQYQPRTCVYRITYNSNPIPDGQPVNVGMLQGVVADGREAAARLAQYRVALFLLRARQNCEIPEDLTPSRMMSTSCGAEDCVVGAQLGCASFGSYPTKIDWAEKDHCTWKCANGAGGTSDCEDVKAKKDDNSLDNQQTGGGEQ